MFFALGRVYSLHGWSWSTTFSWSRSSILLRSKHAERKFVRCNSRPSEIVLRSWKIQHLGWFNSAWVFDSFFGDRRDSFLLTLLMIRCCIWVFWCVPLDVAVSLCYTTREVDDTIACLKQNIDQRRVIGAWCRDFLSRGDFLKVLFGEEVPYFDMPEWIEWEIASSYLVQEVIESVTSAIVISILYARSGWF